MSKMKKVLSMALVVTLTAGIAISGTMAYLTSQDSDVNVMTLGNVKIAQHEYQRVTSDDGEYVTNEIDGQNSYRLEAFKQGKALLPIVGDPSLSSKDPAYAGWDNTTVRMSQVGSYGGMQVFAGKNAQDKFVTVENTGKTDAYVRTLVAIEVGATDGTLIGTSYHTTWTSNYIGIINIDDNNYKLTEYVYAGANGTRHDNGVLPAGDTSYPNLSQVYLKSEATNEDMEAIDGNGNGTLDILVFSQAVQAAGFDNATTALDAAFGDITINNHPWANTVICVDEAWYQNLTATEPYIIDGEGKTVVGVVSSVDAFQWSDDGKIPVMSTIFSSANQTGAKVTVNDITFTGTMSSVMAGQYVDPSSDWYNTEFNNVNIVDAEVVSFSADISPALTVYGKMTMKDCKVTGTTLSALDTDPMWHVYDVALVNNSVTVMNDCEIGSINFWAKAKLTLNDTTVDTIVVRADMNTSPNSGIYVVAGYTVGTIDLSAVTNSSKVNITIAEGGSVGAFVDNGVSYDSIEAWKAAQ